MKKIFLVLFWTFFTNTSVFADDFVDGPVDFVAAPDGKFLPLGGYRTAVTLESTLYFEKLSPEASQELIVALQLAIAARKGDEIPLPHMRAILDPLEMRLMPLIDRKEHTSMRFMLEYCRDALVEKIKIVEDYEIHNGPVR